MHSAIRNDGAEREKWDGSVSVFRGCKLMAAEGQLYWPPEEQGVMGLGCTQTHKQHFVTKDDTTLT